MATATATKKSTAKKTTTKKKKPSPDQTYTCVKCGKEYQIQEGNFYKITQSSMFDWNDKYAPYCKNCISEEVNRLGQKFGDQRIGVMACCHYLDIPYVESLYQSVNEKYDNFSMGVLVRQASNNTQYRGKTFVTTLVDKSLIKTEKEQREEDEVRWSVGEIRDKNTVISIIGYDPFDGYNSKVRKALFQELVKYLDEDGIEDDHYKVSQLVQLVNNNYQINQIDAALSRLDPIRDGGNISELNTLKRTLVANNDKIAKENEISVKNRSDKAAGKSTLTYLMRDLREKDFKEIETNFYNQLRSEGTQWAANMSLKAIKENGFFDENDENDMLEIQYKKIQELQAKLDDALEENRLLLIENDELKEGDKDG